MCNINVSGTSYFNIEYLRVRSSSSSGTGYQHLANALKYFSAFPVIVLSALQRKLSVAHTQVGLSEATVYRAWLVAVLINSCLLGRGKRLGSGALLLRLLRPALALVVPIPPHHPPAQTDVPLSHPLLQRHPHRLPPPLQIVDQLSPHLDYFADFESGIFLLELLEVARRWMWIFFRVETEWVRQIQAGESMDGTLLGDYQTKEDDD
jgi:hypothetical protein